MRSWKPPTRLALSCLLLVSTAGARAWAAGTVGSGTPGSCTDAAFSAALQDGGLVDFDCGAAPHTITLSITYSIAQDTEIDGGGLITLSGGNSKPHIQVFLSATLVLRDIRLRNGSGTYGAIENFGTLHVFDSDISLNTASVSGGAIANHGTAVIEGSTLDQNAADVRGGAIYTDGGEVTLTDTDVTNNAAETAGGGIFVEPGAKVRIQAGSTIVENRTTGATDPQGGGISNDGELIVEDATIDRNECLGESGGAGGGLWNGVEGIASLTDTSVDDNEARAGGGIRTHGDLTLLRVSVDRNGGNIAGGMHIVDGTATLDSVQVRDNGSRFAPAGVYKQSGVLTLSNSTVSGNDPSGLSLIGSGDATITESTISGNLNADYGGGINSSIDQGTLQLRNVTISGNTAAVAGGGMDLDGTVTMTNLTITGNSAPDSSGSNVYLELAASVTVKNTIVANGLGFENCSGPGAFAEASFNLSDDSSCDFGPLRDDIDDKLGSLADNGGPTLTHKPTADSPAVDRGSNADCPEIDQRGAQRFVGDTCDVGAVEVGALATTTTTSTIPLPTTTVTTTSTTVTVTTTTPGETTTTLGETTTTLPSETTTMAPTTTTTPATSTTQITTTSTTLPSGQCGDPIADPVVAAPDSVVVASDALYVLRSAVGSASCAACVCDVDGSGTITATDALRTLKVAVGQSVLLECPPC